MKKRCVGTVRRIRKKTEISKRRLGEILVKKGCKKGGVSL
ncbi:glycosyltransferase [Capnocytophaga sp. oral taxon 323]|nr:glycosyltransferase [Capnocytophaga sp. oral taxon 323]